MENGNAQEIEKRIKFLVFVLGLLLGLGLVLIVSAIYQQTPSLVAPAVLLGIVAIPLVGVIKRLRKSLDP
jgi:uncharacterized membrane protein